MKNPIISSLSKKTKRSYGYIANLWLECLTEVEQEGFDKDDVSFTIRLLEKLRRRLKLKEKQKTLMRFKDFLERD